MPIPDSDPIQVAVITGRNSLKLKVKQGEGIQGPKVNLCPGDGRKLLGNKVKEFKDRRWS